MGETRNQALRAARPEDGVGLYFRSHLSCRRKRCRACPALLQQRGYGPASRGNLACGRAGSTCARSSRSGRMACLEEAAGSRQHHAHPIAAKVTRVEPGRKYLAVHARQLALEPGLQILRRHPRSLLFRLEQAYRDALENYVYRNSRMGLSVLIKETWYKWAFLHFPCKSSSSSACFA